MKIMKQKIVQMIDLYKITKRNNEALLGDLSEYDFMSDYIINFNKLDRSFIAEHANFAPVWNLNIEETTEDVLNAFREDVAAHLEKYKENYKRLSALMSIEYQPLENYRMEETGNDETDGIDVTMEDFGKKTVTDSYGEQNETNNIGKAKHTDIHGEQVETNNIGAVDETHVRGAQSVTDAIGATDENTENLVSAFNSSSYVDVNKSINIQEAHTNTKSSNEYTDTDNIAQHEDTKTLEEYTDTHEEDAKVDTFKKASYIDTHEENAHQNTNSIEYGKKIKHELRRFGNIGVTTSQQMAESEVSLWTKFNFYDIMFMMISKELLVNFDFGINLI